MLHTLWMDLYNQSIYKVFKGKSKTTESLVDNNKYEGIQKCGKSNQCLRMIFLMQKEIE